MSYLATAKFTYRKGRYQTESLKLTGKTCRMDSRLELTEPDREALEQSAKYGHCWLLRRRAQAILLLGQGHEAIQEQFLCQPALSSGQADVIDVVQFAVCALRQPASLAAARRAGDRIHNAPLR